MQFKAIETHLKVILPFRKKFLKENKFQIRYNACHERNWTDSYLLLKGSQAVGYGSIKGLKQISDRDTIFEFYITPSKRSFAPSFYKALINAAQVQFAEAQSNDILNSQMLQIHCTDVEENVILFGESQASLTYPENITFRKVKESDDVFGKKKEDLGGFVLESEGQIVAEGGYMTHYNKPYADLFMEVDPKERRKGYGSFIIQELINDCKKNNLIPAARCLAKNEASKKTLIKAGFNIVGNMLQGKIEGE